MSSQRDRESISRRLQRISPISVVVASVFFAVAVSLFIYSFLFSPVYKPTAPRAAPSSPPPAMNAQLPGYSQSPQPFSTGSAPIRQGDRNQTDILRNHASDANRRASQSLRSEKDSDRAKQPANIGVAGPKAQPGSQCTPRRR